ncbi:hypothetical protein [Paraburkholderia jirisanensis]
MKPSITPTHAIVANVFLIVAAFSDATTPANLREGRWNLQDAPPALFHPGGSSLLLGKDQKWSNTEA